MTRSDSLSFVAALAWLLLGAPLAAAASDPICAPTEFEGAGYTVCHAAPAALELRWRDSEDRPYRSFGALADALKTDGRPLRFAVNAGMYDTEFRPIGLYIEDGRQRVKLNTAEPAAGKKPIPTTRSPMACSSSPGIPPASSAPKIISPPRPSRGSPPSRAHCW